MPRQIHIGGQTRTLELTEETSLVAMTWLPGNRSPREALAFHRDPAIVAIVLAAALRASDPKATPKKVMTWMKAEKARYPEFEAVVMRVATDFYAERGVIEDDDAGEVPPATPPAPSAPHGLSSSVLPADTGSPPATSPVNPSGTEG